MATCCMAWFDATRLIVRLDYSALIKALRTIWHLGFEEVDGQIGHLPISPEFTTDDAS